MSARIVPCVVAKSGGIILRPSYGRARLLCGCEAARLRWLVNWRSPAFVIIEECVACAATWTMADWSNPIPFHSPTAT